MKRKIGFYGKLAAVILLATMVLPLNASVPTCIFYLNYRFMPEEEAGPLGDPWVVAIFEQADQGVRLLVVNTSPHETNVVQRLWFNLNPVYNPSHLAFSFIGSGSGSDDWLISTGIDSYRADGDGFFDIMFVHVGAQNFAPGDWFMYGITGIPSLRVTDFCFLSAPPPPGTPGPHYGPFPAVALLPCFQYITVPEPGAFAMLALGICVWFGRKLLGRHGK